MADTHGVRGFACLVLGRRPLLCAAIAFSAGIAFAGMELLPYALCAFALAPVSAAVVLLFRRSLRRTMAFTLSFMVGFVYCGAVIAANSAKPHMRVTGAYGSAVIRRAVGGGAYVAGSVIINGQPVPGQCTLYNLPEDALPGQVVVFSNAGIRTPSGVPTATGFRYDRYAMCLGAWYGVYCQDAEISGAGSPVFGSARAAALAISRVTEALFPTDSALMTALLIGMRDGVEDETLAAFENTGITHVLAVSGLHVGFWAALLHIMLSRLPIGKRPRAAVTALLLIACCAVTGMSPSVTRATIMALVMLLGRALGRDSDMLTSLAASAFIILAVNPMTLFESGFQLSFLAVTGIALFNDKIRGMLSFTGKTLSGLLSVTVSAQIAVLPLLIIRFNQVSALGLIANPLLVPLSSLVVMMGIPTALLGLVLPMSVMRFIAAPVHALLLALRGAAEVLGGLPFATLTLHTPWAQLAALYFAGVVAILSAKRRAPVGAAALAVAVCVYAMQPALMSSHEFRITAFNVGNADAIYLSHAGSGVLVDCATSVSGVGRALAQRGVGADVFILTHGHDDHGGGLKDLLKYDKVKEIWLWENADFQMYGPDTLAGLDMARAAGIPIRRIAEGDVMYVGAIQLTVLGPQGRSGEENENSLVLLARCAGGSALLLGDTVADVEQSLPGLNVDVIKIAHHGSSTSTSEALLAKVGAKAAIVSVGEGIRNLPSPTVLERISGRGWPAYITRDMGNIDIIITNDGPLARAAR